MTDGTPTDLSGIPLPAASPSGSPVNLGNPAAAAAGSGTHLASTLDFRWPVAFSDAVDPDTLSASAIANCDKPGCATHVQFSLAPQNPEQPDFQSYYLRVISIGSEGLIHPYWDLSGVESQDPQILSYSGAFGSRIQYTGGATGGTQAVATAIPKLAFHSAAQDSDNELIYLFGGVGLTGLNRDLYRFSRSSPGGDWSKVAIPPGGPEARKGAALAYYSGHLFLYGGSTEDGSEYFSDFWKYQIQTNTWTQLSSSISNELAGGGGIPRGDSAVIRRGSLLEIRGGNIDALHASNRVLRLNLAKVLAGGPLESYANITSSLDRPFAATLIQDEFEHPYFAVSAEDPNGSSTALPSIYWLKTSDGYAEADLNLTPSNPTELFSGALAEPVQNEFYYIGGSAGGANASSGTVYRFIYDSSSSTIASADEILTDPLLARFGAISFVENGSIFLHGGYTDQGGSLRPSSDLIEYRPGLNLALNLNASGAGILSCSCDPALVEETFGNPSGNGTELNPYEICSVGQLSHLASNVGNTSYQSAHYRLCANLDFLGSTHVPIGNETSSFQGTFDGNGYQISNFRANGAHKYLGLFGNTTDSTLKNLRFVSPEVVVTHESTNFGGVLAGHAVNTVAREIVIAQGSITAPSSLAVELGGLIGGGAFITVLESEFKGSITASGADAGGILGGANNSTLTGVTFRGALRTNRAGGLMAQTKGSTISNSLAAGSILSESVSGGLIGIAQTSSLSDSASYFDSIEADSSSGSAGGIVGTCASTCSLTRIISSSLLFNGVTTSPFQALGSISGSDYVFWSTGENPYLNNASPPLFNQLFVPGVALRYSDLIDLESVNPAFDFTHTWKYWTTGTGANGFPIPRNAPSP